MSDFVALATDASLWELVTKARWDLHDFCLVVESFQVQASMQAQLNALSLAGVWGDVGKPWQDMVFLLIVLSLAVRCKRVFGLTTMCAHPCQAHFHTLEGSSLQTCATGRQKCRLAIHLHMAKQHHIPCVPIK